MSSTINFSFGIEGVLPQDTAETGGKSRLPENKNLAPQGGQVKDHLVTYFDKFQSKERELLSFVRPELLDRNITAPGQYLKHFRTSLQSLEKLKSDNPQEQRVINDALAVLDVIDGDLELLNEYVAVLQKV